MFDFIHLTPFLPKECLQLELNQKPLLAEQISKLLVIIYYRPFLYSYNHLICISVNSDASHHEAPGFNPAQGLICTDLIYSLCVHLTSHPMTARIGSSPPSTLNWISEREGCIHGWVLSGYSRILPQFKHMHGVMYQWLPVCMCQPHLAL